MALHQRQLDATIKHWEDLRDLAAHVREVIPPYLMDMEMNWRAEHLAFTSRLALDRESNKVVWC